MILLSHLDTFFKIKKKKKSVSLAVKQAICIKEKSIIVLRISSNISLL